MKTILKIIMMLMLPVLVYSQNAQPTSAVRFTDQFGPFHEAYKQSNDFTNRKYIPYPFVREADVAWRKVTWEIIDLREKMNLPLYYPIDTILGRKSLINVIIDGLEKGQLDAFKTPILNNAFEFDANNLFLNVQEVKDLGKRDLQTDFEIRPGVRVDTVITTRWTADEIKQILIKEVWYFNSKDSKLHCEIQGICPIREYEYNGMTRRERMFWLYYPDMREYLSTIPVYNPENDKPLYSYDDLFVKRYFRSYFVQEENVYNNRAIIDYVSGREAQMESERIKNEIFDFEQNLWEN